MNKSVGLKKLIFADYDEPNWLLGHHLSHNKSGKAVIRRCLLEADPYGDYPTKYIEIKAKVWMRKISSGYWAECAKDDTNAIKATYFEIKDV